MKKGKNLSEATKKDHKVAVARLRTGVRIRSVNNSGLGSRIAARFAKAGLMANLPELRGQPARSEAFGKRSFSMPIGHYGSGEGNLSVRRHKLYAQYVDAKHGRRKIEM